ncbi:MAG: cyclic nucleotide-binding domain-containing protein [Candidatus Puniceispirillaceae bacterium]
MIDLLKPLLDWASLPRQTVNAGEMIVAGNEPTSILFCLEDGIASSADNTRYGPGDMLGLCEVLALDRYMTRIDAIGHCRLVVIRRETLEQALQRGGRLVLPLSRSIAADITQRRLAG